MNSRTKLNCFLGLIVLVGGLLFGLCALAFIKYGKYCLCIMAIYLAIYVIADLLSKLFNVNVGWKTVLFPLEIIRLAKNAITPFMIIVLTYIVIGFYSYGIPMLILKALSWSNLIILKENTNLFVVLSLGSIISCYSYNLNKFFVLNSWLKSRSTQKCEHYKEDLALYLSNPSNVTFLIYFFYLLYNVASAFLQLEKGDYIISEKIDGAVLKAFIVYIAYTNMRAKYQIMEIKTEDLLKKTLNLLII